MALTEFWTDVRERNPLFQYSASPPDVQQVTAEELDLALAQKDGWHTFGPLKGFDEKDFDFLPSADRERLTTHVTQFNVIAPELRDACYLVPPNRARRDELSASARPLLRDIILLIGQDRYRNPDAFHFGKLVERELGDHLPEGIAELRFLVGNDWAGDPAFYAWAFVSEESTSTDEKLLSISRRARPLIQEAMQRVASQYFVYLSFRGVGESVAQDEEEEVTV